MCAFACALQMTKFEVFVPVTVNAYDARALQLNNSRRVMELIHAHFMALHYCGYNSIPWNVLEHMDINAVFDRAELPVNVAIAQGYDGWEYEDFSGVLKFTLWSMEDWDDLSSFLHTGWKEAWPTYETVIWQLSPERAMVVKVCSPLPRLCPAFDDMQANHHCLCHHRLCHHRLCHHLASI